MLDRYLLRYFLAVVDQGNFSRAAEACNVAQPTLSVGIAKLERMIGQPVFVRSNQRVELTEAGTRFVSHARRIEREFNTALRAVSLTTDLPPFRLGVLTTIPGSIIAASVADAKPGNLSRFELLFGSERELVGHLAKGRIDVALTLVDRGGGRFAERWIGVEGYVVALSASHSLWGQSEITVEELAEETMIVRRHCEALSETSRFFTERGVRPHFALRSTNDERILQMVAAGLGITVVPSCYAQDSIICPRLAGFNAQRTIGWIAAHGSEHLLATPEAIMKAIEKRLSCISAAA